MSSYQGEYSRRQRLHSKHQKKKDDTDYVLKHIHAKNPRMSRKLGQRIHVNTQWLAKRYEIMRYLVELKLEQHVEISRNLLKTGLRQIIFNSKVDAFFGNRWKHR